MTVVRLTHHCPIVILLYLTQFENSDQQDSQECLMVLMEGLGEDLNRVRNKPYIQSADSNGRPDAVVAEEWWTSYLARERSIMLLFQVSVLQWSDDERSHAAVGRQLSVSRRRTLSSLFLLILYLTRCIHAVSV